MRRQSNTQTQKTIWFRHKLHNQMRHNLKVMRFLAKKGNCMSTKMALMVKIPIYPEVLGDLEAHDLNKEVVLGKTKLIPALDSLTAELEVAVCSGKTNIAVILLLPGLCILITFAIGAQSQVTTLETAPRILPTKSTLSSDTITLKLTKTIRMTTSKL